MATSATSVIPSATCTASTIPSSFTDASVAGVRSARGAAGSQGPSERGRRIFPRPGEAVLAHARGRTRDLRRAAARARRVPARIWRRASSACRATGRSSPSRRSRRAGRSGWTTRASISTTTCATRRCRSRARMSSSASWPAGSSRSGSTARSRCGRCGSSMASRATASRSSRRPTTRWSTASPGVDIATVLFDLSPVPDERGAGRAGRPRPCRPTSSWWPRAWSASRRRRSASRAARSARCSARARRSSSVREAAEGLGEVVWAGMNPAPDVPLNVEIGSHRRVRWVQSRLADFKEIKNALGGTVNDAVLAVVAGALRTLAARPRRAHRGRRAARARAGLDPLRGRARARWATGSPRCAGRCPCTWTTRWSGCAIVQRGDGRAEGVEAGARRRGDRRPERLRAAHAARTGVAAQLLDAPLQPDRHERARGRSSRSTCWGARCRRSCRSRSCPSTTRSRWRS